ncbi:MAG TPA: SRPBCC family protein [Allosphingosinicella sp.]|jgi:uncharacterized membrane protein
MTRKTTTLPDGAGTTTRASSSREPQARGGGSFASAEFGEDVSGQELVVAEGRGRPSAATIVGAAIAGAVAGAAIPFMLAGRSSMRGAGGGRGAEETVVHESVVIDRPARELYDFWRNFENLPRFMDNIQSVDTLDAVRSHWMIKAPAGTSVAFDSRVLDDVPGRSISWESEEGASVPNRGRVEFIETASGTGTNVLVTLSYEPPAGAAGRAIAKLFQREPSVQAREDLQRFKELMESGAG